MGKKSEGERGEEWRNQIKEMELDRRKRPSPFPGREEVNLGKKNHILQRKPPNSISAFDGAGIH